MCGIAGVIGAAAAEREVRAMMDALAHRGPDGEGLVTRRVGAVVATFGHRRLSLVDLEGGAQPMQDADAHALVTYNGELYGFDALRGELEREGARFATRSDTEILAAGFAQRGDAIVDAIDGMFAFAAMDLRSGDVLLARDPFGIKPLYLCELARGGVAFASELAALLTHPAIDARLSAAGVASYLFSDYAHPPTTLAAGVRKLAPGELVWVRGGKLETPRCYASLDELEPDREGDARELEALVKRAVDKQLVADVPVGVFLSGGLDSSYIAALAQRALGDKPLLAFSVAFEDPSFDESSHARTVARHLGIELIERKLDEAALLTSFDDALGSLDEPMGDYSILPTYLLSKLAAEHVKAVLTGDGADELFGGYPTYVAQRWPARLAAPFLSTPLRHVAQAAVFALPSSSAYQALDWKAKRFVGRWDSVTSRRHLRWMSAIDAPEIEHAMWRGAPRPAALDVPVPAHRSAVDQATFLDRVTYMPGSVLTKVDRATMAHGLEARPPFLDLEVARYALRLRRRDKVRGRVGKWLLRKAAREALPPSILERGKHGFSVPLLRWLRGPLRARLEGVLAESPAFEAGAEGHRLDAGYFRRAAQECFALRGDHTKALYDLLVLDHWMRRVGAHW